MLIKCPECELQASDKAITCPHCGYPFQPDFVAPKKVRKSNKRRRLPNGFGQISEIKNRNLRKPFRAMITVGKTPEGRPICKPLKPDSFFETYNDAYMALVEYNKNPYDLDASITVGELYEKWSEEYISSLKSAASGRGIVSCWGYCGSIKDMRVKDVRARHIKGVMDDGIAVIRGEERKPSPGMKSRIKSMFNLMLDYALEYELVDRNYARTFSISKEDMLESKKTQKSHMPFADDEMEKLWEHVDKTKYVDVILIQCYSGWRPRELGLIELSNVNFENMTITGGMKTEAGTDRVVPIHQKIKRLIENRYKEAMALGSKYLINCTDSTAANTQGLYFSYDKYQKRFAKIRDLLKLDKRHRPHDGRMHFVTTAKKYGVDEYAIKYIVGHEITDITEKVYTKRDIDWLHEEMQKIK